MQPKPNVKRLALLGMLAAQAILLSFIENALPPFPFLPPGGKAGFSNIITMYAAGSLGIPGALCIAVVKSLFVLLTRGMTAFLTSLAGGILSTLVMAIAFHKKAPFGCIGIGIIGSTAHQIGQFGVAVLLVGEAMAPYLPFMLLIGCITGCITGTILYFILPVFERTTQKLLLTEHRV